MPRPCCRPKPVCQEQEDFEMKRKKPKNQNPKYRPPQKTKNQSKTNIKVKKKCGGKKSHLYSSFTKCVYIMLNLK
jgi:hypothetical protein